jgi:protein-S-isoprenylcysteine O-methyltransferase Ste14
LVLGTFRFLGWIPIVLGLSVIIWCYGLFLFVGKGTPWPFAPPQRLVLSGPFLFVRNPMESSFLFILLGEVFWLEASVLVFYFLTCFIILHMRQVFIEEPALAKRFGSAYEDYRRSVPRWIPQFKPYKQRQ